MVQVLSYALDWHLRPRLTANAQYASYTMLWLTPRQSLHAMGLGQLQHFEYPTAPILFLIIIIMAFTPKQRDRPQTGLL